MFLTLSRMLWGYNNYNNFLDTQQSLHISYRAANYIILFTNDTSKQQVASLQCTWELWSYKHKWPLIKKQKHPLYILQTWYFNLRVTIFIPIAHF